MAETIPTRDRMPGDYYQTNDDSCRTTSWIFEHFGLSLDSDRPQIISDHAPKGYEGRPNLLSVLKSNGNAPEAHPASLKSAMRTVSRTSSIPSSPDSYSDAEPYMWSSISSFSIDESSTTGCKTPKSVRFDEDASPEIFSTWDSEDYDRRPIEPATAEERSCELPPACREDLWLKAKVIGSQTRFPGTSSNTNPCPEAENWGLSDAQYGPEKTSEASDDLEESLDISLQDDTIETLDHQSDIDQFDHDTVGDAADRSDDEDTNIGHSENTRQGMCAMGNCTRNDLYSTMDVLGGF